MTFKTFLPMGEKPPDIIMSRLLPPSSTTFLLIVVNFYMLSTLATIIWALPIQCHTTQPHRNPATTSNDFYTMNTTIHTTTITTINTTTFVNISTTGSNNIDTMINSLAHPITIISLTLATVVTAAATTTAKATVFSTAPTTKVSLLLQHEPNSNQASFENNSASYPL